SERVMVVHGAGGVDELSLAGPSEVTELRNGEVRTYRLMPADTGLPEAPVTALKGGDGAHNAAALRRVLDGERSHYRDVVLLNAGASLLVAGKVDDLRHGIAIAADAIASGRARAALDRLVAISNAA